MGKISTNPKSIESRERKAAAAADAKAAKEKAKEDAKWVDNDKERTKATKDARAKAAADKREAELARKAANKELYEAEMASMTSKPKKKKGNENANKVTKAMILQAQMAQLEKSKKKNKKKEKVVEVEQTEIEENLNKLDLGTVATTVDEAIDALGSSSVDKHPEKRMKASYAKFEDARYEMVKSENPSLKRSQIKEIIWKEWQKSPENSMNQPRD